MKFSVLISCHNNGRSIVRTLSDFKNVYGEYEILIVDDGSTDDSVLLLEQAIIDFPNKNIKVFVTENKGSAHARNLALIQASGKFVIFLDADDSLNMEVFGELINSSQDFINVSAIRFQYCDNSGVIKESMELDYETLLSQKGYWRFVYRREFLICNRISFLPDFLQAGGFYILDDWYFLLQFLASKPSITFSSSILYNYDNHEKNDYFEGRYLKQIALEHRAINTLISSARDFENVNFHFICKSVFERCRMIALLLPVRPSLKVRWRILKSCLKLQLTLGNKREWKYVAKTFLLFLRTIR